MLMDNCEQFINVHLDDENEGKEGEQKIEDVLTIHAQF